MSRNKNKHLILLLGLLLLIILIVNILLYVKIHIVYTSGIGPFFQIGFIILAIIILYLKG
ncbi:hypothetical protein WQ54_20830 [Bacillus sp. SA1-12]|uniref:hypothetical protein n=1 Tax=Bacillus sp. SA1-12 TaxID=1455638 RepID=UPI0006273CC4|nr:hypothetical protein [Bacillus sp. SA1-12]KKI90407.1 hypothetical protein WQ54_20830 [Bacillus sp. SA1-12]